MQHSVSTSYLHIVYFPLNATSIRYNSCRYVLLLCNAIRNETERYYNVDRRTKQALLHTFITSQFDFDFDLVVELTSFTQTDQMHEANVRMRPSAQPSQPTTKECNILDLPNRLYQFGEKVHTCQMANSVCLRSRVQPYTGLLQLTARYQTYSQDL